LLGGFSFCTSGINVSIAFQSGTARTPQADELRLETRNQLLLLLTPRLPHHSIQIETATRELP
jgi:hypothetical protein